MASNAQTSAAPESATLQALLDEVRQLRLAIERSTTVGVQVQLGLQRIQLQQDRVNRLTRQSQDLQDRTRGMAAHRNEIAASLKQGESMVEREQDPAERKRIEDHMKSLASEIELNTVREQQLAAEEIQISSQLQTEQVRLTDLMGQLDTLEKRLRDEQTPARR